MVTEQSSSVNMYLHTQPRPLAHHHRHRVQLEAEGSCRARSTTLRHPSFDQEWLLEDPRFYSKSTHFSPVPPQRPGCLFPSQEARNWQNRLLHTIHHGCRRCKCEQKIKLTYPFFTTPFWQPMFQVMFISTFTPPKIKTQCRNCIKNNL